jgi:hypothetical protein
MKVNEVINESEPTRIDTDGITAQIRLKCSQFLREANTPIYRGMSAQLNKSIFTPIQTAGFRVPRDTPNIINTYIVKWFKDNVGIPYRQANTLFATGSMKEASDYGRTFMVFPVGNFEYCWSPMYKDLTVQFEYMQGNHYSADQVKEEVDRMMYKGHYEFNHGLQQAIMSRKEIMIYCKEYYILDYDAVFTDYRTRVQNPHGFIEGLFKK